MTAAPAAQVIPVLLTSGLSAGYGGVPVVHDVEIRVDPGEVVALLGPNGAGKSTTMLAIAGHLPAAAGTVSLDGVALHGSVHKRARKGIAYVSEDRAVFHTLTTAENLRLGNGGIDDALKYVPELRPLLARRAGLLSGGEQQFLAVARALATQPRLLMIDELSLGLAPLVVERVLEAVRATADSGVGVLIVEQYAQRALAVADRVYVMRRGRMALNGPASEVRERLGEIEGMYLSAQDGL